MSNVQEKNVQRAWVRADWLTRTFVPVWLDLARARDAARRLRELPPIRSGADVKRAVEVLDAARADAEAILGDMAVIAEARCGIARRRAAEGLPDTIDIAYDWGMRATWDDAWEMGEAIWIAASKTGSGTVGSFAVEDAAYRTATVAAEAARAVVHDEIRDVADEAAEAAVGSDPETAARAVAHATMEARCTVFNRLHRSACELIGCES